VNSIRNVVRLVAIENLTYFCVEFSFAVKIGSVSQFADSIDFLEDASVNILIFVAMGWSLLARRRLSKFFAMLLLIPAISVLISTIYEINNPSTPSAMSLTAVGAGALIVNFTCALLLAKYRSSQKSLILAVYLSARNHALANVAIITTGVITIFRSSSIPDLVVGLATGTLNANAAVKVWQSTEH
jgi:Co/Zn/Cd efflux system component